MDLAELLRTIVIPRPDGSLAAINVAKTLLDYLGSAGGTVNTETYSLRPQVYLCLAAALFVLALLAYQALHARRWRLAFVVACLAGTLYVLEGLAGLPLVSSLVEQPAENIVWDWAPSGPAGSSPAPVVILTAHYDTRTEIFAPAVARSLAGKAPLALVGLLVIIVLGFVAENSRSLGFLDYGFGRGLLLTAAWLCLLGLGVAGVALNGGRGASLPSPGATDNAGSLAVLAHVAQDVPDIGLEHVAVRLVLFSGGETGCQGSAAYVRAHPELARTGAVVINLEETGAGGRLAYREWGGLGLRVAPASEDVADLVDRAIAAGTNEPALGSLPGARDDAGSFLVSGVDAITLSESRPLEHEVAHTAADTVDRLSTADIDRVAEVLEITLSLADLEASLNSGVSLSPLLGGN